MSTSEQNEASEDFKFYGKYIAGTEKLWKNNDCKFIEKIIIDGKVIGRKYLVNKSISYLEIWEDKRLNVIGLSKKISLLFIPNEKSEDILNFKNCFGFRYYGNNNMDKCDYFTLIKKSRKGYYILEKEGGIIDVDNDLFYNEKLDCYSIMKNIVFEKYKADRINNKSPNGELFSEIIGYTYSMISLGQFKNYKILEPFIPYRMEPKSLIEEIPKNMDENIGYIEPILYDNHVSILLIEKDKNNKRKNYLFDMSKHHSEKNIYDPTLFPNDMINDVIIYPTISIQKNNSCGLWYYGILELLYCDSNYSGLQDIVNKIKFNKSDFYLDIINILAKKIYGIDNMINFKDIDEEDEIDLKRIYFQNNGDNLSLSKECIMNYYFSLSEEYGWKETSKVNISGLNILFNYEILFEKMFNYKREIEMNNEYFKEFSDTEYYNKNIKSDLEFQLKKVIACLKDVKNNFYREFHNLSLDNATEYIFFNENKSLKDFEKKLKSLKIMKATDITRLEENFMKIKKNFESFHLVDESTIINNINPNHELLFQLMNK